MEAAKSIACGQNTIVYVVVVSAVSREVTSKIFKIINYRKMKTSCPSDRGYINSIIMCWRNITSRFFLRRKGSQIWKPFFPYQHGPQDPSEQNA